LSEEFTSPFLAALRACKAKFGYNLVISSREANKLSEEDWRKLHNLGVSPIGFRAIGSRTLEFKVLESKNVNKISELLENKGVKARLVYGVIHTCPPE